MKLPIVSIIVVNFNGKKYLRDCFTSLANLNYPKDKIEIIMVDNGSTDGSLEYTEKHFSEVKIIKNDINNYCRANNLGIKQAKGEFILLQNNDVVAEKDVLRELMLVISQDNKIGAVTGKILFPDGKIQCVGHYMMPNYYWADRGFREDDHGQYNEAEEIDSLSHCFALYRKECLNNVGELDESFNMYLEDIDLSIRQKQEQWKIFYVPKAVVYHKFHGSVDEKTVDFYCERNRLLLVAKHYPEKLPQTLLGQGYFTVLRDARKRFIEILPEIFNKISIHHGPAMVIRLLPDIFKNMQEIMNYEKDYLVKHIDVLKSYISSKEAEIIRLNERIEQEVRFIAKRDKIIKDREEEIIRLNERIEQEISYVIERDKIIENKEHIIADLNERIKYGHSVILERDDTIKGKEEKIICLEEEIKRKLNIITERNKVISEKHREIMRLNSEIQEMLNSETFRFLICPAWKMLDRIKLLFKKCKQCIGSFIFFIKKIIKNIRHVFTNLAEKASQSIKYIIKAILGNIIFVFIIILFFIFIAVPLRLKKIFRVNV
ncbi:MAG: glycosyltransferase [Candidatus Omnitrophota bacterium]